MRLHFHFLLAFHLGLTASAQSVDADSAVTLALAQNPALTAARISLVEAKGRSEQAGRLANPALETEYKPGLDGEQGTVKVGMQQQFPLTSRLRLERQVSRTLLQAAQADVRDVSRRLAAQVRSTVFEVAALQARLTLRDAQIDRSEDWTRQLTQQATVGERARFDADQLRLDIAALKLDRQRLATEHQNALSRLRVLIGLPPESPVEVTQHLTPPEPGVSREILLAQRGDYQAAQARTAAAQTAAALAQARRWEDVGVGVFGEWQRTEDLPYGIREDQYVGLQVSLPLPFWNRQQGRIREVRAAAEREAVELSALAQRIQGEAEIAQRDREMAAALASELSGDLLPAAQRLEESLEKQAIQGQDVWNQWWRARERRFELEAASIDARRDYHLAHTRWLAATGQLPTLTPPPALPASAPRP
jgi:cobalt-zinc-cadmium efflux system outer membrane protein